MRAILSVSDKTGLVELGRGLAAAGVELVSTGGTAKALAEAGLPVVQRVRRHRLPRNDGRPGQDAASGSPRRHPRPAQPPDDLAALAARASRLSTSSSSTSIRSPRRPQNPTTPFDALVEEIDIGGPSLIRAAAKNFRDVLVVVDPADYPRVVGELGAHGGPSLEFRFELMQKAFAHTAQYDGTDRR